MNNSFEINYIRKCLELAEARLNRGDASEWTSYDFEKLSAAIEEATGVILSVTTLKRLWGKLKYTNMPATTTLNTLAQFAGYADWREFKRLVTLLPGPGTIAATGDETTGLLPGDDSTSVNTAPGDASTATPRKRSKWTYWLLGLIPLGILVYALLLSNTKPGKPLDTTAFSFSSNKVVADGVPNSVIFNYNAAAAGNDSVFIAQTWDIRRKIPVSAKEKTYTAIYYEPGYFKAKLMVNKQIIKEHDLMIGSGGWLAMIERELGTPLYFRKSEVAKGNGIEVNEALLSAYHVPLQPVPPALRFYNVQPLGDIKTDHFTFETTLKSDFQQGTAACQRVEVLILCKNDLISIPLCAPGCVGDLSLFAAGTAINSRNTDLSKFGADLTKWVKLRVVAKDRHMQFFVNDSAAAALTIANPPSGIVGVQYRFNGTGAVKDTRFTKDSAVIALQQ
ncbi:hypothetical protein [Chitinophaga ginsengisegetis]|uniref:hypothetical protein n=1 Tax=Chitinophaga ginsengisegetis TaxID=393003 RepID=UPI000DB98D24|nr:hypothetical protein [Chitinophaga ginsengisegetis]MDR6567497.1 hypothetical protein [Chitinophaga ginsengisegetis]MDR6647228.1 hypothetical protein [Chitinophaga ginsengisegetis]MDR6653577.1 hypothetical protein [Chitinophaga ginsengisegetis]